VIVEQLHGEVARYLRLSLVRKRESSKHHCEGLVLDTGQNMIIVHYSGLSDRPVENKTNRHDLFRTYL
jgi:hypothetical protein